jgi:threonine dehydrogenase-like Zn-dependent dehydrogenase
MSSEITSSSRRAFLGAAMTAASYQRVLGANERVRIGFIGCGLIGLRHIADFKLIPDAELAAVCDVYEPRIGYAQEKCGSSPIFPLLKREDEKYVTELAYNNPRFVEDILREVTLKVRELNEVTWFEVDCEALESIHNHSAWAYHKEII